MGLKKSKFYYILLAGSFLYIPMILGGLGGGYIASRIGFSESLGGMVGFILVLSLMGKKMGVTLVVQESMKRYRESRLLLLKRCIKPAIIIFLYVFPASILMIFHNLVDNKAFLLLYSLGLFFITSWCMYYMLFDPNLKNIKK